MLEDSLRVTGEVLISEHYFYFVRVGTLHFQDSIYLFAKSLSYGKGVAQDQNLEE